MPGSRDAMKLTPMSLPMIAFSRATLLRSVVSASLLVSLNAGCGAKTGLEAPDVEMDASTDVEQRDVPFVRYEACVPGRFGLIRRRAEVTFVIDRSGSMDAPLEATLADAGRAFSRWTMLRDSLRVTLVGDVESRLSMGALFFPRVPVVMSPTQEELCTVNPLGRPTNIIAPRLNNAAAILRVFDETRPWGGTPTLEAVTAAGEPLLELARTDPDRSKARYLIVATDGGPNCNPTIPPEQCVCAVEDPTGRDVCAENPALARWFCLDRSNVVSKIEEFASQGLYTYVIGLDNPSERPMIETLNAMAVAGRRANPIGDFRYYSVRRSDQLFATFRDIATTITTCAFVTPSRPDDPTNIRVEVGGLVIPRDAAHINGWDWSDEGYGEITLYGRACERAVEAPVSALVGCR
jgi:predicted small lipoprotein YifL